jgi:hypothetical protein
MSHVWSAFIVLNATISYQEIKTWKELTDTPLSSWEIEAIKRVDVVFMGTMNDK